MWLALRTSRSSVQVGARGLDLTDMDARFVFAAHVRDRIWGDSLVDDCGRGEKEVFRVSVATAFRDPEMQMAEARLQDGAPVSASYQPPRPPFPDRSEIPVAHRSEPRLLSAEEFQLIQRKAARLQEDGIPLTRGKLGLDGSALTLEFCHGSQYGFYHLYNPAADHEQDIRIVEVANAILISAGESPIDFGADLSLQKDK